MKAVWPPPKPAIQAPAPAPAPRPEPGLRHPGGMGYTDVPLLRAWEATLSGKRLRTWEDLRDALEGTDAATRAAAVSLCMELDLADGRAAYSTAWKAEQRFKADLIKANGKQLAEKISWVNTSVQQALGALEAHRAVGAWAMRKAQHALDHLRALALVRTQFQRVHGPWSDCTPGAEWGQGITGYDTPEGVAEARQRHEARMAQAQRERQAQARRLAAEAQPQVDVQREADRKAAEAREAARKAEEAARVAAPPPRPGDERQAGLFGRR